MSRSWLPFAATCLAVVVTALPKAQGPANEFKPDTTFTGSSLTGWTTLGSADWQAQNRRNRRPPARPAARAGGSSSTGRIRTSTFLRASGCRAVQGRRAVSHAEDRRGHDGHLRVARRSQDIPIDAGCGRPGDRARRTAAGAAVCACCAAAGSQSESAACSGRCAPGRIFDGGRRPRRRSRDAADAVARADSAASRAYVRTIGIC